MTSSRRCGVLNSLSTQFTWFTGATAIITKDNTHTPSPTKEFLLTVGVSCSMADQFSSHYNVLHRNRW